ncbi:Gp37-like protein [Streptomyces pseudogriseolus]|uniref:Gp37-like protein n=1 Tax=Streptomyces pseudogriseolus TaxID=36817 RepID=UPI003FA1B9EC
MGYRVEVFDRDLKRVGEIDEWISLDFTVRLRQPGYWQLLIKDGTPQAQLIEKGGGVVIWQEGVSEPVLSGQVETYQKYWTKLQHTGPGSLYIAGQCHNGYTTRRLAFPAPSKALNQQYQGPSAYTVNKAASGAAWDLVASNLGPNAVANRRESRIAFGARPTTGAVVKDSLRYEQISTKLEEWCEAKKLGYRFIYNPDTQAVDFRVFHFRDKSKEVRFSAELGNLREVIWTLSAPKLTRAIVGCQGEGKSRFVWQKIDADAESEWDMSIETFIDRRDIPLKAGKTGGAELVTTIMDNGWEDIGTNPDGGEWTTALANAKAAYEAAVAQDPNGNHDVEYDAVVYAIRDAKPVAVDYYLNVVDEAATSALAEGQRKGNFQIYPIDTPDCQFGKHYFVGDTVTVYVDGTEYTDVVREVVVSVDDGGNVQDVQPKIGEQGTGEPLNLYKTVYEMQRKLRRLESRM